MTTTNRAPAEPSTVPPPTQHPPPGAPPPTAPYRVGRVRAVARVLAVVACVPYVGLKLAWLAGSRAGIPDGSPLLDGGVVLAVGNAATVLMVGCVVALALLLTRPWGLRVPACLLVVPMWVASGLLLPVMTAFPLQMTVRLLGGDGGQASGGAGDPFLEPWVFGVVYGGFIVQGLALGTLFALYARERWGHLWQGRLRDLPRTPSSPVLRVAAVAAALVALAPGLAHLFWAAGSTAGLDEGRVAGRTSDFHVLEAVNALFVAAAVTGVLLLAFRREGRLPLRVPLVLVWAGSAQVACWGGWLSLAALVGAGDVADRPTTAMVLIYAGQMLVGTLIALPVAHLLAERAAASETFGRRA
ncbi:hypothetical protein [Streptomyces cyaneofuscatus]|uniref:Aromatic ring-opening dioxygenase LigA n=1 Tax=Streptomyces cyaneofuscatus TaxID=66883 RepID=A0ABZ1ES62_9ACTN|nr:hypothetical protein [Streptomyces cyaneofuscatus]WSB06972.1 hypothetical protein OG849_06835 [Streptomyces cyaneofuscatus]WSD49493.1 hypothetical protein OG857_28560 [Streptomyces cyaneofuscatus]